MASKPETVFYTAIHRLLPRAVHKEKMSNPYRGGTPDVWYSGNKGDLWTEYKWVARAPKKAFKANLSPLQIKWLSERHREGRNVAVVVGSPKGVTILRNLEWERSIEPHFTSSRQATADWIRNEVAYADTTEDAT